MAALNLKDDSRQSGLRTVCGNSHTDAAAAARQADE
jgi:hypothetical protein